MFENVYGRGYNEYGYNAYPYDEELELIAKRERYQQRNSKKVISTARQWNESAWGSASTTESLHVSDAITEALRERGELSRYESFSF